VSKSPTATKQSHTKVQHEGERSHAEIMVVVSALMLTMLLAALDQTIVSTALPQIGIDLHSVDKLSWVATSYLLASAIVTPIYGKLGDMYGRKKIFLSSIIIFLIGSVLCGLSQNIGQLIVFRAIQGLGGGGLMALIFAIIGDLVPPRQRGRYQGYFGAVFAVSSVAGPLLGGLFTDHLNWHWIFYINLPLGLLALWAVVTKLHLPVHRSPHAIDYPGSALMTLSIVSLILVTVWGGLDYAWGSPQIIGLIFSTFFFGTLFVIRERYAKEPILPLKLFKNDIFVTSILLSILSGMAMFAAILYIPQYQQIVRGNTPTESGLLMLPLVVGMLGASLIAGRLTTKFGRYKIFPIIGTLTLTLGIYLFSHLTLTTSHVVLSLWMFIIGAGLGQFMQIPTLAVQNSTPRQYLGTATSSVVFFRSIGTSLGGAIFGNILISRLSKHIQEALPHAGKISHQAITSGVGNLPPEVKHVVLQAYVRSFHDMFLIALPIALAAFVTSLFLREAPLRTTHEVPAPQALQPERTL
jgi:EmrB/QacA subfamily drug resistance transporter